MGWGWVKGRGKNRFILIGLGPLKLMKAIKSAMQFQTRRFLNKFSIGSSVKLSLTIVTNFVGGQVGWRLAQ